MSTLLIKEGQFLLESGLRNIRELSKRYDKAKIYFHQDLDGVTTALGMKNYLENNGIEVVDAEVIQYGDREFAVKKPSAKGDVMPVLVDFAHGKPMFVIHTDHPDKHMISTVDSADFVKQDLKPEDIMTYIFQMNKEKDLSRNKKIMALVTNKLLLAYKNKPNFLERLVLDSTPSLISIYLNIVKLAKEEGYVSPDVMKQNLNTYIDRQSKSENVKYDEEYGIISQYGGGALFKPGSYDRYVPFKLHPEANFIVLAWPMGLLQSSCNPFKASRELKGVNLGEIAQDVLRVHEKELKRKIITIDTVKYFAEKSRQFNEESVGFNFTDMVAMFEDTETGVMGLDSPPAGASADYTVERWHAALKKVMDKPYKSLKDKEIKALKLLKISGWDMIQANSGGHKCITNISGLMYFGKDGLPMLKKLAKEFVKHLKSKIDSDK
jgi:hypothetical protein